MRGVLVVDDYASMRELVSSLLVRANIQVCGQAENGETAIERVQQLHPELVLLDINMPVMDGIQACREIRLKAPATKIIFLTMHETYERQMLSLGADAFVSKSTAQRDLIPTVERFFPNSGKPIFAESPQCSLELESQGPPWLALMVLVLALIMILVLWGRVPRRPRLPHEAPPGNATGSSDLFPLRRTLPTRALFLKTVLLSQSRSTTWKDTAVNRPS